MAIKNRTAVYVSDRGQEFELDEMEFSHLLNAYSHHSRQLEVLAKLQQETVQKPHISARLEEHARNIQANLEVLAAEIVNRDPANPDLDVHTSTDLFPSVRRRRQAY